MNSFKKEILTKDAMDEIVRIVGDKNIVEADGKVIFKLPQAELKTFIFNVNILDGDLTPCLNLSYVYCGKSKRYYNLKDKDLPKGRYIWGNESIEEWRRLE